MDRDTALTRLHQVERAIATLHAVRADLLVQVAGSAPVVEELLVLDPRPGDDAERVIRIEDAAREEIAAALRWSPSTAHARIDEARLLAGPLKETATALRRGSISPAHAAVIAEAARRLPGRFSADPDAALLFSRSCELLEKHVLPVATRNTVSATRHAANRAVLRLDPAGVRRRHEEQRCKRDVWVSDELDGMSTLMARLTTVDAHAILAAVQGRADTLPAGALAGERRAEALHDLVIGGAAGNGVEVRLDVVVSAAAFVGDSDTPAEVNGSPIPAAEVRGLLADPTTRATIRRLITDERTGHLLDRSPRRYEIPRALRDFIVARDRHCRFPGCRRRASACQIDHAVAFEDGGKTTVANCGALCVRHHQLKTHGGWEIVDSAADGSCTWISPMGRRYHVPPRSIIPEEDPPPF